MRTVRQAADALLIVTDHPVPQRLPIHAAGLGGCSPAMTFQHQSKRQKPARHRRFGNARGTLANESASCSNHVICTVIAVPPISSG